MQGISRARFLGLAAGFGGAAALPATAGRASALATAPAPAPSSASAGGGGGDGGGDRPRGGLRYRGVVYEVAEGETPGTAWSTERMRGDMRAISRRLHADSVKVTGAGVERLTATAAEAAERGLDVWLEPTLGDVPEREILEHLAETGRFAERLRRQGAGVHLSVGCEFWLFVPGIVPGDNAVERIENLVNGDFDPVLMARRLDRFTAKAAAVGRSVFRGRLTYAAAQDDEVDWDLFDLVGIDYYSYFGSRAEYVRDLARFRRFGKPVAVMEFGCCTFEGAPQAGGMGWDVVDYAKDPPEIKGGLVRSERAQAAYLTDLLSVFESMGLYSAMAFTFVTPDAPHLAHDPLHDLDMASYGIVKPVRDRPADPASDWHWEPKESFRALSRQYARAGGRSPRPR
ncbi:abortive phage infection protein [Streptomyces sp. NPDC127072]|uniref:abortive phage infection protein n=1 Tax=Streptomyces sp. NPDC127072 TaxID=3347129 RepID=UPI00366447E1